MKEVDGLMNENKNMLSAEIYDETKKMVKSIYDSLGITNNLNQVFLDLVDMSGITAGVKAYQKLVSDMFVGTMTDVLTNNMGIVVKDILKDVWSSSAADKELIEGVKKLVPTISKLNESLYVNKQEEKTKDEKMDIPLPEYNELKDEMVELVTLSKRDTVSAVEKIKIWKREHPVQSFLIFQILLAIIINIISNYACDFIDGFIIKKAKIYQEPKSDSEVVINIDVEQNVIILDSVPYYYKVKIEDEQTDNQFIGYIYKSNIKTLSDVLCDQVQESMNILFEKK